MSKPGSDSPAGRRIVVVGGGFSGATFAVQLVRRTRETVHIWIVEPREHLGRGLAYSAQDPDHRLNGPLAVQAIDPEHPEDLLRWCEASQVAENDPDAKMPSGHLFLRRSAIGEYLSGEVARHAEDKRLGSTIRHVRDSALDVVATDDALRVTTTSHGDLLADMVVIATGNPVPALRKPFAPEHARHPRIVANPLEAGSLDAIPPDAHVLVVGSGLTALDMISTLVRRSHLGRLTVVSRRGLRPREQSPEIRGVAPPRGPAVSFIDKINAPIPAFIAREPVSVRRWCRALRKEIARVEQAGRTWHEPFDAVRDVVWKLWPQLPLSEKQRFLRRLRLFYDIHRFRTPPMNEQMVRLAEQDGQVRYLAASVAQVITNQENGPVVVVLDEVEDGQRRHAFDYVVNCTGLDSGSTSSGNPLLASLEKRGVFRRHDTGLGYDVTSNCEAIAGDGHVQPLLRVIGPPTAGVFGDPLGAIYISMQANRILPDVMRTLEARVDHGTGAQRLDYQQFDRTAKEFVFHR